MSPEAGSGKSRALEVSEPLVPRAVLVSNISPAYLFRRIADADGPPTLLLDEVDTLFGKNAHMYEDLRGLINAGHRRGAQVGRCEVIDKRIAARDYAAFAPWDSPDSANCRARFRRDPS